MGAGGAAWGAAGCRDHLDMAASGHPADDREPAAGLQRWAELADVDRAGHASGKLCGFWSLLVEFRTCFEPTAIC